MKDLTGITLGKYQVLERLGRGGMADVYRAYQPGMDRYVAIKVMHGHLSEDPGFIERFKREAQSVGTLRHPNIVQVIDFDAVDNEYYMVMEFIEGDSLKALLTRRGALPVDEAIALMMKIADAVAYAHRAGMIHRDLKPANILMTKGGEPILTDFGVAKILSATNLTGTGVAIGTPAYMSPEAGRGDKVDERADIYSLGIMFYEMVTGMLPFDADTPWAVILKHISEPLPRPTAVLPGLPQAVERIMLKALSKDPNERYQTASDMREALVKASQGLPEAQLTATEVASDKPTTQVAQKTKASAPAPSASGSGSRNWVFGLLTLLLILGAGAVYIFNERSRTVAPDVQTATAVAVIPTSTAISAPTDTAIPATNTPMLEPSATVVPTATLAPPEAVAPLASEDKHEELTKQVAQWMRDGQLDVALDAVAQPLSNDPQNYYLQQLYALILMQYREDGEKLEQAKGMAEAGIEALPDLPQAYYVMAQYWGISPNEDYKQALDLTTQAIDRGLTNSVDPYLFRATMRYYIGEPPESVLADMSKAVELEPNNESLYRRRGFYLMELYRLDEAQTDLLKALELWPENFIELHTAIAWIYIMQEQPDKAFDLYRNILGTQAVSDAGYLTDAAIIAIRTDHPEEATQWASDARAIEPGLAAAKYAQAWIAWAERDFEAALELLDEIAESDDPYAYRSSALLEWHRLGREIETDRAWLLLELGQKDEAIEALQAAINNYSDWFDPYESLAKLYIEEGEEEAAREVLQQALEIATRHNDLGERERALALLKELGE
jgi:serine/threonine protein kinase/tetratricopeptide (TPR) repeat protein